MVIKFYDGTRRKVGHFIDIVVLKVKTRHFLQASRRVTLFYAQVKKEKKKKRKRTFSLAKVADINDKYEQSEADHSKESPTESVRGVLHR